MHLLIGTRPNFIRVTRVKAGAAALGLGTVTVVHTGQHYDPARAGV